MVGEQPGICLSAFTEGKKGPKNQGNFVGKYYWVPNKYKGLSFRVRVFCAALLFFVFTSGVL
jgi:hypothetical protein